MSNPFTQSDNENGFVMNDEFASTSANSAQETNFADFSNSQATDLTKKSILPQPQQMKKTKNKKNPKTLKTTKMKVKKKNTNGIIFTKANFIKDGSILNFSTF